MKDWAHPRNDLAIGNIVMENGFKNEAIVLDITKITTRIWLKLFANFLPLFDDFSNWTVQNFEKASNLVLFRYIWNPFFAGFGYYPIHH